jgi:protein-disulfide isomerase
MLEEFADFQCPSCATVHGVLKSLKAEFGPRVVIVFREFPLVRLHANALHAARAAEAAGMQGRFWEMHDLLYKNQELWDDASDVQPIFEEYAKSIGLDLNSFKRDVSSSMVERRITSDQERGRWIGVNGTPTLFMNGREIPPDSLTLDKLRAEVTSELKSLNK